MNVSAKLTNNYLNMLFPLSDEMKIYIINKLSESLMTKKDNSKIEELFGAWKDNRTAEDIIADIRNHRMTGTRQIESFDE